MRESYIIRRMWGALSDIVVITIDGHTFASRSDAVDWLKQLGFTVEDADEYLRSIKAR